MFPLAAPSAQSCGPLRRFVRTAGLASLLPLSFACGEPPLRPRAPSEGAPHFTVMSYNIELGAAGESETLEAIGSVDADIVCLQEVTPSAEVVLRADYAEQYPFQLFKSKGGAGGLAALSRFPLVDLGLRAAPQGWHPSWHLEVASPAGPIQLLNVHLRSLFSGDSNPVTSFFRTDSDHLQQIELFSNECEADVPTIALGDFNEDVDGEAIGFLEERGFYNLLPAFHPGQPTWGVRSVGNQLGATIDHILVNDHLVPLDAWVRRLGRSDHMPVIAHLEPSTW
jgi:vancomycin resistance protein VanJ